MNSGSVSKAHAKYDGKGGDLFKLALWTTFLTLLTLGIYRFWAKTRIRRYIWSSAHIDEDRFEYTGTGLEKFLGFLIAIVFLAIYLGILQMVLFFVGLNMFVQPQTEAELYAQIFALYITIFALIPFMFFAQYRARRYKLARTRWRGIRFGADPAAWAFVLKAIGHSLVTMISLGILLPRQTFYLEKFMTDRSHFGDEKFHQHGKWTELYPAMKHLFIGAGVLVGLILVSFFLKAPALAAIGALIGYIWILVGMVSYRVTSFGYLTGQKTLGEDIRFETHPRTSTVVGTLIIGSLVIGLIVGVLLAIAAALGYKQITGGGGLNASGILAVAMYIGGFVIAAPLSLVMITQPILAHFIEATSVVNAEALSRINQRAGDTGADAEGFADALDIGGAI